MKYLVSIASYDGKELNFEKHGLFANKGLAIAYCMRKYKSFCNQVGLPEQGMGVCLFRAQLRNHLSAFNTSYFKISADIVKIDNYGRVLY